MVVDTSALIAILQDEPERPRLTAALDADSTRLLSTAAFVEASMLTERRRGAAGVAELDHLLVRAQVELRPVDEDQALVARRAFAIYGKGRHPAGLNFGDCFSYALAKVSGEPLLFKGADFGQTDLPAASY